MLKKECLEKMQENLWKMLKNNGFLIFNVILPISTCKLQIYIYSEITVETGYMQKVYTLQVFAI